MDLNLVYYKLYLNFDLYEYFIQDRKYYNASIDVYGTYFFGYIMAIYIKYCLDNKEISKALKSIQRMTIEDISDMLNLKVAERLLKNYNVNVKSLNNVCN